MIVESMREATRKELIERIKELEQENREIREWKYVIDNPIDLEKLKELDLIKIKGKEYISKDKIKAKIEEVDIEIQCCEYADDDTEEYKKDIEKEKRRLLRDKKVLQSLLEKE